MKNSLVLKQFQKVGRYLTTGLALLLAIGTTMVPATCYAENLNQGQPVYGVPGDWGCSIAEHPEGIPSSYVCILTESCDDVSPANMLCPIGYHAKFNPARASESEAYPCERNRRTCAGHSPLECSAGYHIEYVYIGGYSGYQEQCVPNPIVCDPYVGCGPRG